MAKRNYIEEAKELTKNLKFDKETQRLFEDYLMFLEKDNVTKDLVKKLKAMRNENIFTSNDIDFCHFANSIFIGRKNNSPDRQMSHIRFEKGIECSSLSEIVLTNLEPSIVNSAIIDDYKNFVNQILNLAQAMGETFEFGYPYDEHKLHIVIDSSINVVCNLTMKGRFTNFFQLLHRFIQYNLMVYSDKISHKNKTEKIKKLSVKFEASKILYAHLKEFFDNEDFIYAILSYLNTEEKIELFNLCINKNESWSNHEPMDNILNYIDNAYYMSDDEFKPQRKVRFICDSLERFKAHKDGKELYNELKKMNSNDNSIYCTLSHLNSDDEILEVLNKIKSGMNDYSSVMAYCEYIGARNAYKTNQFDKAMNKINLILDFYKPENIEFYQEIQQKMINREEL